MSPLRIAEGQWCGLTAPKEGSLTMAMLSLAPDRVGLIQAIFREFNETL
jgi:hypothetical protein